MTTPAAPARRAQPPQNPPPVQWLQVRYCKRGRARFTSHRDFARALERAIRRSGVPMALSSGFNPHPRISYIGASATGAATEADYVELGLAQAVDPAWLRDALTAALPDGMAVVAVGERGASGVDRPLVELLTASGWRVDLPEQQAGVLADALNALLAASSAPVQRETKNGLRSFDARASVLHARPLDDRSFELVLSHTTPLVRPDDVVQALSAVEPRLALDLAPLFTRLTQGEWCDGVMREPLGVVSG